MAEQVRRIVSGGAGTAARWLIVVILAIVVVMLGSELVSSQPQADGRTGWSGSDNDGQRVFAIAGQVTRDTYGLYLVDMKNGTICLYQFLGDGTLKLRAARTFIYDCRLDEYHTTPPVKEIKELVEKAKRLKDITTRSKGR